MVPDMPDCMLATNAMNDFDVDCYYEVLASLMLLDCNMSYVC